ncbi:MAG: fibronectin type III domain-containing protein, partial [Acidobacteriota bacterium]
PVAETTYTDPGLDAGVYAYTVRALSASGAESPDSNSLDVRINLSGPVARISLPSDGERLSDLVDVIGTAFRESGLAGWTLFVRADGGPFTPLGSGTAPVSVDFLATWDTAQPQYPDGFYDLKLEVDDVFGNRATDQVRVEVDNSEPVAPVLTDAFAFADGFEVDDIRVEWTLDPVPADLAGYYLYRNGQLANAPGPVIGSQAPFLIDALAYEDLDLPDGTYVYYVTAADTAENESAASNLSDPIVIETRRPRAIIVDPPDGSEFEDAVLLTAEVEDLDVVSVQFEVRPDAAADFTTLGPLLERPPWVAELAVDDPGVYHVRAVAADATGPDPAPPSIALTETDLAPDGPADLTLRVDGGDVALTWPPVADPSGDLAGYRIYRRGEVLTSTLLDPSQLSYDDLDLEDGFYDYRIAAVDAADQEAFSPYRNAFIETPRLRFTPPISAASSRTLQGEIERYGQQVTLERRVGAGAFEAVATISSPDESDLTFPDVALEPGLNALRIRGEDGDGNRSRFSRALVLLRHDPPAPPVDVTAEVAAFDVTVDWREDPPDPDNDGFRVYRDGTPLGEGESAFAYEVGVHALSASSSGADLERAVDGDLGTVWAPEPGDIADGASWQWTFPTPLTADRVELDWGPVRPRAFSIEVLVDGAWLWWVERPFNFSGSFVQPLGPRIDGVRVVLPPGTFACSGCSLAEVRLVGRSRPAGPPYLDAGVAAGAYLYDVEAVNRYDQRSTPAAVLALVGSEPPAPPESPAVVATGCGELTVSWQPPSTLPAVHLGYRVYRDAGGGFQPAAQLPPTELSFVDVDLVIGA